MKTRQTYLPTAALALPLLLFAVGCDGGPGIDPPPPSPEAAYQIDCFVPDGTVQMLFEANGALEDEGTVEALGAYRVFNGEKGTVAVRVEVTPRDGAHRVEGTFTVLGGSGVYALLEKEGDFYEALDERGEPIEVFKGRLNGAP